MYLIAIPGILLASRWLFVGQTLVDLLFQLFAVGAASVIVWLAVLSCFGHSLSSLWHDYRAQILSTYVAPVVALAFWLAGMFSVGQLEGAVAPSASPRLPFTVLTHSSGSVCPIGQPATLLRAYSSGYLLHVEGGITWVPTDARSPCWTTKTKRSTLSQSLVVPTLLGIPIESLAFEAQALSRARD
jgi:hypothetical protein